jgi:methionyl-tRNA formyltransferase
VTPARSPQPSHRIAFIGVNALFSARHLAALARAFPVVGVVETVRRLSRLKRVQRRLAPSLLEIAARDAGASFHVVTHGDNAALTHHLRDLAPDLVVVAGMGWLLERAALAVPRLGTLNVHPALLPAYRGAEPTFWQLFGGVAESGLTIHLVDEAEDRGPIVRQQAFPVPPGITLAEFLARQLEIGPPLLVAAVQDVLDGTARPVPQPAASPTRRATRLRATDTSPATWLDRGLDRTWRLLRGVGPVLGFPPARWRDLGRIRVVDGMSAAPHGLAPGRIGRDSSGPFLAHPEGRIRLRYRWAPRPWLTALRRGNGPAMGIIAAEKAAWPPLERLLDP